MAVKREFSNTIQTFCHLAKKYKVELEIWTMHNRGKNQISHINKPFIDDYKKIFIGNSNLYIIKAKFIRHKSCIILGLMVSLRIKIHKSLPLNLKIKGKYLSFCATEELGEAKNSNNSPIDDFDLLRLVIIQAILQ